MPRARTSPDDSGVKKRTTTKRTGSSSTLRVRRSPKKSDPTEAPKAASKSPRAEATRKAPTPIASERASEKSANVALIIVAAVSVVLMATGILIGVSDSGQIDVAAVIAEENERIGRGEVIDPSTGQPMTRTIPVQNTAVQGSGNLRASSRPTPPPPAPTEPVGEPAGDEVSTTTSAIGDTSTSTTTPAEAEEVGGVEEGVSDSESGGEGEAESALE